MTTHPPLSGSRLRRIELLKAVRAAKKNPTVEQQLSLQERRRRLQSRIDSFTLRGGEYIGDFATLPSNTLEQDWLDADEDEDDSVPSTLSVADLPVIVDVTNPEQQSIPLPSSYDKERWTSSLRRLAKCELKLREGQANDALHLLRVAIAHKSFIFRTRIRKNAPNTNFAKRLRSYGDARAVQMSIDSAAKVYSTARKAMITLGADDELLDRYQLLTRDDLHASTAVANSNEAGQGKKKLSWIWRTDSDNDDPVFVTESAPLLQYTLMFIVVLMISFSVSR